jgi:hypothetical protein
VSFLYLLLDENSLHPPSEKALEREEPGEGERMRRRVSFLSISFLLCVLVDLSAQTGPGVKIINRGFVIDKQHKEGPASIVEKVDSNHAFQSDQQSTANTWVYANAWIGAVEAWIAGTFYVDFEITGLPSGSSLVAPAILARIKLFGLADSFGIGHADTNYRIEIVSGLTENLDFKWSQAARRKTIFSKREKETWKSADFVTTLATAAGQALVSEIPAVGDALDVVLEASTSAWDAIACEAKIARRGWVRFPNVPLVVGRRYRAFITVESQVKAAAIGAGQRSIKVDFYGRAPFFTAETKDLKEWGFGIEAINVIFPDSARVTSSGRSLTASRPSPPPRSDVFYSKKPELAGAERLAEGNYRIIEGLPATMEIGLTSRHGEERKVRVLVRVPELKWQESLLFPVVPQGTSAVSSVRLPELRLPSKVPHKAYQIETVIDHAAELGNEARANNTETTSLLVVSRYLQLKARNIRLEPAQAEYGENQPVRISATIKNDSNVDLKTVEAAFFYNSGTRDKVNLVLIEKKTLSLKKGEETAVSCSWKARGSGEHWTDISFIADPDDAIEEAVENAALHEARTSIVVKK